MSNIQLMLVCHVTASRSHHNEDKGQTKRTIHDGLQHGKFIITTGVFSVGSTVVLKKISHQNPLSPSGLKITLMMSVLKTNTELSDIQLCKL